MMKLNDLRPEIEAINEEMRNSTDPRSMEVGKQKLGELFIRHGVTPFTRWKGLFIQGTIFMTFFFAISNMVKKVPSLKGGGAYWFTDLTTPDDLFILPVLASLSFLATAELDMQDGREGYPTAKSLKKFSRFYAVMFVPCTIGFPKAYFFVFVSSSLFYLVYSVVIQKPAIRLWLDLPPLESQPTPARMQALSLFGEPKPSPGVYSPIADKECKQSGVGSPIANNECKQSGVGSPIADKECEQSGVDSPIADKEHKQSSSVLIDRIRDLENRAKSRGEPLE